MIQIFSVISVFVLLYHLKDVISIALSKKFILLGVLLGDQEKSWAPHQVCTTCVETLISWSQGKNAKLKVGVPIVLREPKNHVDDCYFCLVNVKGFNKKNKQHLQYPNIHSAMRPIPHGDKILYPFLPSFRTLMRTSLGLPRLQLILMMMMKNRI